MYSVDFIKNIFANKNYKWDNKINIVGIRNSSTNLKVTNLFDDLITISYFKDNKWEYKEYPATVDPGTKAVLNYSNPKGVARLVEGQYIDSYSIGLHKGKYTALRQSKPVKVYRDNNKDMNFDQNVIDNGLFGINIHKAGTNSIYVENWSEGCQVFKKESDFNEFMNIVKSYNLKYYTYTLISI